MPLSGKKNIRYIAWVLWFVSLRFPPCIGRNSFSKLIAPFSGGEKQRPLAHPGWFPTWRRRRRGEGTCTVTSRPRCIVWSPQLARGPTFSLSFSFPAWGKAQVYSGKQLLCTLGFYDWSGLIMDVDPRHFLDFVSLTYSSAPPLKNYEFKTVIDLRGTTGVKQSENLVLQRTTLYIYF